MPFQDVSNCASRRRTKGGGGGDKKEKKDEKDKKEEEELEDLSHLEPNATLKCVRCLGGACVESLDDGHAAVEKVLCEPGEICWVNFSIRIENMSDKV